MTKEYVQQHLTNVWNLHRLEAALRAVTDERAKMDISARVGVLRLAVETEAGEISRFAEGIADTYVRVIFLSRYVDGLTWGEIAVKLGGGNTADGVRKVCERGIEFR